MTNNTIVTQDNAAELRQLAADAKTEHDAQPYFKGATVNQHASRGVGVVEIRDDEITQSVRTSGHFSASDMINDDETQGVMSTVRRASGSPVIGEQRDSDLIKVEGMEVSLQVAQTMGLVRKNGHGQYEDFASPKR